MMASVSRTEPAATVAVARDEAQALAVLAGQGLAGVVERIEDVHRAVFGRVSRLAGANPLHDAIAGAVYGGLKTGGAALGRGAGLATSALAPQRRVLSRTPLGSLAVSTLNGFLGDRFEAEDNPLALGIAVRRAGEDVELTREALSAAYPVARPRLAVFLHGLCENEDAWRMRAARRGGTYGSRLEADLGISPVYVRYNTGLHISENGRRLSELLDVLLAEWPAHVADVTLIGHSMGGLVARS